MALCVCVAGLGAAGPVGGWAFPGMGVDGTGEAAGSGGVRLAGSGVVFRRSDFDGFKAIDWFPGTHPRAPGVVMRSGGGGVYPCGYCHLPDGGGRPENARLQGLPADYILAQVRAFASGRRRAAVPYVPTDLMASVARAVRPADLAAATAYFSQFEPRSHTQIVETATIPAAAAWHFVYRFDGSRREALGERIVEGPVDGARFELRDPETRYVAYVPLGAIGRGRVIAEHGASGGPACETCHGQVLVGIAGASPSFLARQLMGFRSKARDDADAAPMQAVAGRLTDGQIVDVAAFVGSRAPWTLAEMRKLGGSETAPLLSRGR